MKLLLDTHVFLWAIAQPDKLSAHHTLALETPTNSVFLSSISVAEIVIKASIGKLDADFDIAAAAQAAGFETLTFSVDAAQRLKTLPLHHRDPFDRMLIAQAMHTGYTLVTVDRKFAAYDCKLLGI
ncbi:MAG: type II toxin-antitoxin system VapC family toxin [Gammaproteobacteria bacterium]